jgi:type VI secretion system protein ImpK
VDAIYWASAEVLVAATRLGTDRDMPALETLRQELLRLLQQMVTRCRKAGISDKQIAEARYAVVAFIDDRILRSNWSGRVAWMNQPLQLQLYNEFAAGENFFVRMRALVEAGESQALEVYYLCLALGFVGATGAAERSQTTIDRARERLAPLPPRAALSPHAVPADHYSATTPRRPLVLGLVLSCLAIVGLGLGLLRWSLDTRMEQNERDLAAALARSAEAKERP